MNHALAVAQHIFRLLLMSRRVDALGPAGLELSSSHGNLSVSSHANLKLHSNTGQVMKTMKIINMMMMRDDENDKDDADNEKLKHSPKSKPKTNRELAKVESTHSKRLIMKS